MPLLSGSRFGAADDGNMRPPARLPQINGLRGLAIIGVLSFHILAGMFTAQGISPLLSVPLTNGWSGVNLFFILSGFVLFLPYAGDDGAVARLANPLGFYRRRCRRLLPLFYTATLITWALAVVRGAPADPGQLLSVLSFGFILDAHSFGPSFNMPLWSLGDEIAFSVLFPVLTLVVGRHGIWRIFAVTAVVALAMRIIGIWRFPALQSATFNSDMFLCRVDEFVLGMALAHLYAMGWSPRRPVLWAAVGAALVLLAWTGFDLVLREEWPPPCRAGLNDLLDAGLAAIVIGALAPGTGLAALLAWRPLQLIGVMCYSIYIWHMPLLQLIAPDRAAMPGPVFAFRIAAFLVVTFATAALSYRFIEFPRTGDWRRLFLLRRANAA